MSSTFCCVFYATHPDIQTPNSNSHFQEDIDIDKFRSRFHVESASRIPARALRLSMFRKGDQNWPFPRESFRPTTTIRNCDQRCCTGDLGYRQSILQSQNDEGGFQTHARRSRKAESQISHTFKRQSFSSSFYFFISFLWLSCTIPD